MRITFGLSSPLQCQKTLCSVSLIALMFASCRSASDGCTTLLDCSKSGNTAAVEKLIAAKADVNAIGPDGSTPLLNGIEAGSLPVVEALIRAGANVNQKSTIVKWTPLSKAAYFDRASLVSLLLQCGANWKDADRFGDLPIHYAARNNNPEILKLLLSSGCPVDVRDNGGRTALFLAGLNRSPSAATLTTLLIAGANPNVVVGNRRVIDWAWENDNWEEMKILRQYGSVPPKKLVEPVTERTER